MKTKIPITIEDSVIGSGAENFAVIPYIISGERKEKLYELNLSDGTTFTVSLLSEKEAKEFGSTVSTQINKFYQKQRKENHE